MDTAEFANDQQAKTIYNYENTMKKTIQDLCGSLV
jgi:hypothetical protein